MRCQFCAEEIQDQAVVCRYCGAEKSADGTWTRGGRTEHDASDEAVAPRQADPVSHNKAVDTSSGVAITEATGPRSRRLLVEVIWVAAALALLIGLSLGWEWYSGRDLRAACEAANRASESWFDAGWEMAKEGSKALSTPSWRAFRKDILVLSEAAKNSGNPVLIEQAQEVKDGTAFAEATSEYGGNVYGEQGEQLGSGGLDQVEEAFYVINGVCPGVSPRPRNPRPTVT